MIVGQIDGYGMDAHYLVVAVFFVLHSYFTSLSQNLWDQHRVRNTRYSSRVCNVYLLFYYSIAYSA